MSNGWRIIITVVLIVILLGGICMGAGIITGAEMSHIYTELDEQYNLAEFYRNMQDWIGNTMEQFRSAFFDDLPQVTPPAENI